MSKGLLLYAILYLLLNFSFLGCDLVLLALPLYTISPSPLRKLQRSHEGVRVKLPNNIPSMPLSQGSRICIVF